MINTNGYEEKLLQSLKEETALEQQNADIQKILIPFYAAVGRLKEKYNFDKVQKDSVEIKHKISKQQSITDYYKFRMLIDGIVNLLMKYGYEYEDKLLRYLHINHEINIYRIESLSYLFQDDVVETTPDGGYTSRIYLHHQIMGIRYMSDHNEFSVEFPVQSEIKGILIFAENRLKEYIEQDKSKKEEKEYQEYLRLKEKFGENNDK
jgi:hypothetical protein